MPVNLLEILTRLHKTHKSSKWNDKICCLCLQTAQKCFHLTSLQYVLYHVTRLFHFGRWREELEDVRAAKPEANICKRWMFLTRRQDAFQPKHLLWTLTSWFLPLNQRWPPGKAKFHQHNKCNPYITYLWSAETHIQHLSFWSGC